MNPASERLASLLTYSGTLPLIACAIMQVLPAQYLVIALDYVRIALSYSAVILSFISGIHWAASMFHTQTCPYPLLITSNIIALAAWASLWIENTTTTLLIQALCFVSLLVIDRSIFRAGMYPEWFYRLRCRGSIIVLTAIATLLVAS